MINIALVYAPPSKEYRDVIWSSKDAPSPPQTGAVELTAYLKKYSKKELNIICIPSQKTDGNKIKYFTNKEIINLCKRRDFIGFTCLYHNQNRTIEIATQLKKENPNTKIILGGQNVSSKFIAELILNKAKEIDYIVCGDGEKALLGIIENKNKKQIPNIAYRTNEKIEFTKRKATNLDKIPVWDYEAIINKNDILDAHDSRTKTYKELLKKYNGRTPPEIGVFSQRGCPKAYGELGGPKGPCIYCTSWESSRNKMHPDKFWKQIKFLYEKYGLQDFFIGDNVFGTSINELKEFIK